MSLESSAARTGPDGSKRASERGQAVQCSAVHTYIRVALTSVALSVHTPAFFLLYQPSRCPLIPLSSSLSLALSLSLTFSSVSSPIELVSHARLLAVYESIHPGLHLYLSI